MFKLWEHMEVSKITITVSGETGSGKSAIAGEIEIALKAIGVPVTMAERDTMVVADYQYWIDLYKPEVTIVEQNLVNGAPPNKAHKVMTPEEYAAMPLKGWHEVCRDIDGFGGTGIRFLT